MNEARDVQSDLLEIRRSHVHGLGAFAVQPIRKGTRLIEYTGERVSHAEADRRYAEKDANDSHTFLFIVDSKTVIDAGVAGNDARFINHSCDPNCESVITGGRIFIEALRDIAPGTELTYDYQIQREDSDPDNIDEIFACHCGFAACRGTMLWPAKRARKRRTKRPAARGKSAPGRNAGGKSTGRRNASGRNARGRKSRRIAPRDAGRARPETTRAKSRGGDARRSGAPRGGKQSAARSKRNVSAKRSAPAKGSASTKRAALGRRSGAASRRRRGSLHGGGAKRRVKQTNAAERRRGARRR